MVLCGFVLLSSAHLVIGRVEGGGTLAEVDWAVLH
jgi:hypothetical protein